MNEKTYKVEKIVMGGEGIIRDESQTIFVPFAIPGEEISISIKERGSKKVRGKIEKIITPSSSRIKAPCALFEKCGGCDFQHIAYDAQLKIKREIVAETLSRIAKVNANVREIAPAPKSYNYRSRIRLHVEGRRIGFYSERKREFLKVDYCHLAYDAINDTLQSLEKLIYSERADSVEIISALDGSISACVESGSRRRMFERVGNDQWVYMPGKQNSFEQVNREQNQVLKNEIGHILGDIKPKRAIELYAGSGNFTEVLIEHCGEVFAVEYDKNAVTLAKEKFGNRVEFVTDRSERFLEGFGADENKSTVLLLDPPRTGAMEALDGIIKISPNHIVYISCDPATFSRDLKKLAEAGYSLESVQPIDMFPQTAHIELLAVITKS